MKDPFMPIPSDLAPPWGLYLISDEAQLRDRSFLAVLDAALDAGLKIVQLRAKTLTPDAWQTLAADVRERTRRAGALMIVNDRPELAVALDADGVHIGQNDMPAEQARKIIGPDRVLGYSTHNPSQIKAAAELPVDYIGIGPIYETVTKEQADPAVGLELLRWAAANSPHPFVAIGGINEERLDEVVKAGAQNVAVISAIAKAENPPEKARRLTERLRD